MKNLALLFVSGCFVFFACQKESRSERFMLLTGPTWTSDSLLYNGEEAGDPGEKLAKFNGDMKFQEDGSGYFGQYIGTWRFSSDETVLVIYSDSLQFALMANIAELTKASLKIYTVFPNLANPLEPINIRMTFKAK